MSDTPERIEELMHPDAINDMIDWLSEFGTPEDYARVRLMCDKITALEAENAELRRYSLADEEIEIAAENVHNAYLATCAALGWDVKPENRVRYLELDERSKQLDRASVHAVLDTLAALQADGEKEEKYND